ncbi:MAG: FAD-binding protein [Clostridia bacterium]|nr:FAD-binding protein [Clostridia bacterium]
MKNHISRRSFLKGTAASALGMTLAGLTSTAGAEETKSFEQMINWDAEYDVVVIGYGFAGETSAIAAADKGAKVLLLEKAPQGHEGGNSRYAGQGLVCIEGGEDNREAALDYFKLIRGKYTTPGDDILEVFVDGLLKIENWFTEHGGNPVINAKAIGEFKDIPGWDLMNAWSQNGKTWDAGFFLALQKCINEHANIDCWFSAPATSFIQDDTTKIVHGVKVEIEGKTYNVRAKNGVVLCTGGFENNIQMIQDFNQLPYAYSKGALYNTGDGIKMAMEIGADLWHMNNTAGPDLNAIDPDTKRAVGYACIGPHPMLSTAFSLNSVILVGADGTRFANESIIPGHGFIDFHGMKIRQPISLPAYLVFDQEAFGKVIYKNWNNEEKVADGTIKKAETLDELTSILGLPEGSLAATVAQYNKYCADGMDPACGRGADTLIALSENGPYYAFEVVPTYTNTQGGPRRNKDGHIVDTKGNPIPHLYSSGECGSIWGDIYQGAGNIAECVVFGLISGENAAAEKADNFRGSVMEGKTPVNFAAEKAVFEAGENEYIGVAQGMGGDVKIKVVAENGQIKDVVVLEHHETQNLGDVALEKLVAQAKEIGAAEVDSIAGATTTSRAFKEALTDALSLMK